MLPVYSIIVPLYNEERRIKHHIPEIISYFEKVEQPVEIIFVNDGSTDRTLELLESYKYHSWVRTISYKSNRGKGYAVRQGVSVAMGRWIVFFDVDLATPLSEFDHLRSFMEPSDLIIVGSRNLADSRMIKKESALRMFLGRGFGWLSAIFVPGISDFTCGFKCYSRFAAQTIFPKARINRWAFDTELLFIAKIKNIPIREMPVTWAHDTDSRVRVFHDVLSSARELACIFFNWILGRYDGS